MTREVLFLNDREYLNRVYRTDLMNLFEGCGSVVHSFGLRNILSFSLIYYSRKDRPICIFSNLRTNLLSILIFWAYGINIINGIGRKRQNRTFRLCFFYGWSLLSRRKFIFQNYCDYRYSRRFFKLNCYWVPGSGGAVRRIGASGIVMVSRAGKFNVQHSSILEMIAKLNLQRISVIGVAEEEVNDSPGSLDFVGFQSQSELFSQGNIFLQPDGHGEGVPHSLVDAICSGMCIIMSKRSYIQYGFHKFENRGCDDNYFMFSPSTKLIEALNKKTVNDKYYEIAWSIFNANKNY